MKQGFLIILCLLCTLKLRAQKDTIWNQPFSIELQFGQLGSLQKQPLLWDALDGYFLRRGNDIGIRFAARFDEKWSFVSRYKVAVFGPEYSTLSNRLEETRAGINYHVRSYFWSVHQLHAGIAFQVVKNRWCFEVEQYLGISIINAPFLEVIGYGLALDTIHVFAFRGPQHVPAVSFYSTVALKYFVARRIYIFGRAEIDTHLALSPIKVQSVFGIPDMHRKLPDPVFLVSGQIGLGWILGKPMPEKLFKRRKRKDRL